MNSAQGPDKPSRLVGIRLDGAIGASIRNCLFVGDMDPIRATNCRDVEVSGCMHVGGTHRPHEEHRPHEDESEELQQSDPVHPHRGQGAGTRSTYLGARSRFVGRVPGMCLDPRCGQIFDSGYSISNTKGFSVEGCLMTGCPACGGMGQAIEGSYSALADQFFAELVNENDRDLLVEVGFALLRVDEGANLATELGVVAATHPRAALAARRLAFLTAESGRALARAMLKQVWAWLMMCTAAVPAGLAVEHFKQPSPAPEPITAPAPAPGTLSPKDREAMRQLLEAFREGRLPPSGSR